MCSEIFQEISDENIPEMLQSLQHDWPKHFLIHQIVTVVREYIKSGSLWNYNVYLHGDYTTGVYLFRLMFLEAGKEIFYIYNASEDIESVKESLTNTNLIPWQSKLSFHMVPSNITDVIRDVYALKHPTCNTLDVHHNTMFWYPPYKQIQCNQQIPEDVTFQFLDESYAEEMDKNWPHRFPGSVKILSENLKRNFGLGILRKSDRKLLCSALSAYSGGIFVLFTDPEFRGKGYATMLVIKMTEEIRLRGRIPMCTVIFGNKASETAFKKAGFEFHSTVDYIV